MATRSNKVGIGATLNTFLGILKHVLGDKPAASSPLRRFAAFLVGRRLIDACLAATAHPQGSGFNAIGVDWQHPSSHRMAGRR